MELNDVKITRKAVYLGGEEVAWPIAEGGIEIKPGGRNDINQLTITFLVGKVEVADGANEVDE